MTKSLLFFILLSITSCSNKSSSKHTNQPGEKHSTIEPGAIVNSPTDSTVVVFDDTSYKLTVHIFDTANKFKQEKMNAVLSFSKRTGDEVRVLSSDSLFCLYPDISFQDFNNDKVKDVLIFYYTGGRSNPTYHLYLTDAKNCELIRVKGFEKLPNPNLDTTDNIITSIALAGFFDNMYSFYRITKGNKLINLGHGFTENPKDSTQYDRAIRRILSDLKEKERFLK